MNNAPRASNKVSLYQAGKWQAIKRHHIPTIEEALMACQAVFIVDESIQRAKESRNDN